MWSYVAVAYAAVTLTIEAYVVHDVWSAHRRGGSVGYHYFPDVVWVLAWPLVVPINLVADWWRRRQRRKS